MDCRDTDRRCSGRGSDNEWNRSRSCQWFALAAILIVVVAIVFTIGASSLGCVTKRTLIPFDNLTDCETAYDWILGLGCDDLLVVPGPDEKENTYDDIDWIKFCEQAEQSDYYKLNLDAAMQSDDCEEIAKVL